MKLLKLKNILVFFTILKTFGEATSEDSIDAEPVHKPVNVIERSLHNFHDPVLADDELGIQKNNVPHRFSVNQLEPDLAMTIFDNKDTGAKNPLQRTTTISNQPSLDASNRGRRQVRQVKDEKFKEYDILNADFNVDEETERAQPVEEHIVFTPQVKVKPKSKSGMELPLIDVIETFLKESLNIESGEENEVTSTTQNVTTTMKQTTQSPTKQENTVIATTTTKQVENLELKLGSKEEIIVKEAENLTQDFKSEESTKQKLINDWKKDKTEFKIGSTAHRSIVDNMIKKKRVIHSNFISHRVKREDDETLSNVTTTATTTTTATSSATNNITPKTTRLITRHSGTVRVPRTTPNAMGLTTTTPTLTEPVTKTITNTTEILPKLIHPNLNKTAQDIFKDLPPVSSSNIGEKKSIVIEVDNQQEKSEERDNSTTAVQQVQQQPLITKKKKAVSAGKRRLVIKNIPFGQQKQISHVQHGIQKQTSSRQNIADGNILSSASNSTLWQNNVNNTTPTNQPLAHTITEKPTITSQLKQITPKTSNNVGVEDSDLFDETQREENGNRRIKTKINN